MSTSCCNTETMPTSVRRPSPPGAPSTARGLSAPSTRLAGGHRIWWSVEAPDEALALALLPVFVARRTEAIAVRHVKVP